MSIDIFEYIQSQTIREQKMNHILSCFIILFQLLTSASALKKCSDSQNKDFLCLPDDYDPNEPPEYDPFDVRAMFDLADVYGIDDFAESIELKVKIELSWYDPR